MLLWFHVVFPSFPARIDDMRSRFSALISSSILTVRPSTSTNQRLSKLDTRFSRLARHFFGVRFERCEMSCSREFVSISRSFSLFKSFTLADRIQSTFTSSLCTISSGFWWHTSGENIDMNQQQQGIGKPFLSSRMSCT